MGLSNFLLNTVIWAFTMQMSTFLHEFGHCLPILALTPGNVEMILGFGKMKNSFKIGRLHLHLKGFAPWVGFMKVKEDVLLTKKLSLLLSLGGPAVSLLIGTSAFLLRFYANSGLLYSVLSVTACYNWYLFICTAVPIVYPQWWIGYSGYPSDGYRVLKLLTGKKTTSSR
ncbi:MAG: hypothetical protein GX335_07900 [Firmicutes bacterium]|nr:hypothetical protein [Bacillota bacterium]